MSNPQENSFMKDNVYSISRVCLFGSSLCWFILHFQFISMFMSRRGSQWMWEKMDQGRCCFNVGSVLTWRKSASVHVSHEDFKWNF